MHWLKAVIPQWPQLPYIWLFVKICVCLTLTLRWICFLLMWLMCHNHNILLSNHFYIISSLHGNTGQSCKCCEEHTTTKSTHSLIQRLENRNFMLLSMVCSSNAEACDNVWVSTPLTQPVLNRQDHGPMLYRLRVKAVIKTEIIGKTTKEIYRDTEKEIRG